MRAFRFSQKVTLLNLCSVLIAGVCLTFLCTRAYQSHLKHSEEQTALLLFTHLADQFRYELNVLGADEPPTQMGQILTEILTEDALLNNVNLKVSGGWIVQGERGRTLTLPLYQPLPNATESSLTSPLTYKEDVIIFNSTISLPDSAAPIQLYLYAESEYVHNIHDIYYRALVFLLTVSLAVAPLSLYASHRLLTPVNTLISGAKRLRNGEYDFDIDVPQRDEIGLLAQAFNKTIEVTRYRINLSKRILRWISRTRALTDPEDIIKEFLNEAQDIADAEGLCILSGTERKPVLSYKTGEGLSDSVIEDHIHKIRKHCDDDLFYGLRENDNTHVFYPFHVSPFEKQILWVVVRHIWTHDEITGFQNFVENGSSNIQAAIYQKEADQKQAYEQELALARQIQISMHPPSSPPIERYNIFGFSTAAKEVGGDYFDFIRSANKIWHFVLADVSGKGVSAALVMSSVRSLFHTLGEVNSDAAKLLSSVHHSYDQSLKMDHYLTVGLASLHPESNTIQVARAGHEPLLLLRASGVIEELMPTGTAVGLFDAETFQEELTTVSISLEIGDTLIIFSDGITETSNQRQQFYGQPGLEASLRKHGTKNLTDAMQSVLSDVEQFRQDTEQADDITILAIRRTD